MPAPSSCAPLPNLGNHPPHRGADARRRRTFLAGSKYPRVGEDALRYFLNSAQPTGSD